MPTNTAPRGASLTAADLAALRKHVVHTADGKLAQTAPTKPRTVEEFATTADDVRRIVMTDLAAFVERQTGKAAKGDVPPPVPVLIWAHGGLTDKRAGLQTAHHQVAWWKKNGVYPIHLVWESGLLTTLADVISGRATGKRGFTDITDAAVEAAARVLGGRRFWDDMKLDSAAACLPAMKDGARGGADVLAGALREYMAANQGAIEIHVAGHSAGSIYHSHFVPRLFDGADAVDHVASVTFLAPAVRLDTFEATLLPLAETGKIHDVAIFTMDETHEKRDNTAGVYRKSLLYLVSRAFEAEKGAKILGLDEHLRTAGRTMAYLGDDPGRLVKGPISKGRLSSTQATSHGDFDNDVETMMSLARRVVGVPDSDEPDGVAEFPPRAREVVLDAVGSRTPRPEPTGVRGAVPRKLALCIGIDKYPKDPLGGCVADANAWGAALEAAKFDVEYLRDGDATRDEILRAMLDKVSTARDGDIIAIQFAGHGTFVPDLDGDETDAFGASDEALCPVDFRGGELIVDDDLAAIWDAIPDGVAATLFFDSCHSGTVNRGLTRSEFGTKQYPAGATPRMTVLDGEEEEAFRSKRAAALGDEFRRAAWDRVVAVETDRAAEAPAPRGDPREVLVSACQPDQVALETNGHGVFTTAALAVLAKSPGLTNSEFVAAVFDIIDDDYEQRPLLSAAGPLASRVLLTSLHDVVEKQKLVTDTDTDTDGGRSPADVRTAAIVAILRATADLLESATE
ncbi:caspase family protein [Microbacterium trichothecenolyticum]|uniref:caspase family protein n=1 Tax=Microbacterium trichothecenolyticum TaxID=69370 RepID=UPI001C6E58BA|nr:caspase family protein [Microbacterium trichothecenolyticum]MBW9121997.1 caspase family protein [Microbacterium trichothecenolyticum]